VYEDVDRMAERIARKRQAAPALYRVDAVVRRGWTKMRIKMFFLKSPCEKVAYLLDQYSKGEVSQDVSRSIERHLGACGGCRKELQVVDRVLSLVDSLDRAEPGRDLWPHIKRALNQPAPRVGWISFRLSPLDSLPGMTGAGYSRWFGPLAAGGAIAAAIGFGVFWPHPQTNATSRLEPAPPRAVLVETTPVSYASQAERASLFDPLSDRASLGAVVENVAQNDGPYRLHIDNAVSMRTSEGGFQ